ncbi:unnamed protein product [Sympodiomycopsis kandeliae]
MRANACIQKPSGNSDRNSSGCARWASDQHSRKLLWKFIETLSKHHLHLALQATGIITTLSPHLKILLQTKDAIKALRAEALLRGSYEARCWASQSGQARAEVMNWSIPLKVLKAAGVVLWKASPFKTTSTPGFETIAEAFLEIMLAVFSPVDRPSEEAAQIWD